jgi:hypothetical protein
MARRLKSADARERKCGDVLPRAMQNGRDGLKQVGCRVCSPSKIGAIHPNPKYLLRRFI